MSPGRKKAQASDNNEGIVVRLRLTRDEVNDLKAAKAKHGRKLATEIAYRLRGIVSTAHQISPPVMPLPTLHISSPWQKSLNGGEWSWRENH